MLRLVVTAGGIIDDEVAGALSYAESFWPPSPAPEASKPGGVTEPVFGTVTVMAWRPSTPEEWEIARRSVAMLAANHPCALSTSVKGSSVPHPDLRRCAADMFPAGSRFVGLVAQRGGLPV